MEKKNVGYLVIGVLLVIAILYQLFYKGQRLLPTLWGIEATNIVTPLVTIIFLVIAGIFINYWIKTP